MIHSKTPVTLAEVQDIVGKLDEHQELKAYLKKFNKLKKDKSEKLKEELVALKNIKVKDEHLAKISDFLPTTAEDLKKIFVDVGLTEEETNAILEITKKY